MRIPGQRILRRRDRPLSCVRAPAHRCRAATDVNAPERDLRDSV